jgi:hypothetical protein
MRPTVTRAIPALAPDGASLTAVQKQSRCFCHMNDPDLNHILMPRRPAHRKRHSIPRAARDALAAQHKSRNCPNTRPHNSSASPNSRPRRSWRGSAERSVCLTSKLHPVPSLTRADRNADFLVRPMPNQHKELIGQSGARRITKCPIDHHAFRPHHINPRRNGPCGLPASGSAYAEGHQRKKTSLFMTPSYATSSGLALFSPPTLANRWPRRHCRATGKRPVFPTAECAALGLAGCPQFVRRVQRISRAAQSHANNRAR